MKTFAIITFVFSFAAFAYAQTVDLQYITNYTIESATVVTQKEYFIHKTRYHRSKRYTEIFAENNGKQYILISTNRNIAKQIKKNRIYSLKVRPLGNSHVMNWWEYNELGREAMKIAHQHKIDLLDILYLVDYSCETKCCTFSNRNELDKVTN